MKALKRYILSALAIASLALPAAAQDSSSSTVMRRADRNRNKAQSGPQVTQRMESFYEESPVSDADLAWMRVIYRQIDLTNDKNAPLYFPEEVVDGQENLFRIIMRLLANNQIEAYEYLDGRENFTEQYRVKVRDVLDRFHVLYTEGKGSTEKNPKFQIEEADVPANEVLSYYALEKWEFDTRTNRVRTRVEAICPVLHRSGEWGGEAVRYPMFWVKMDALRPHLAQQYIFTSDDNNLANHTIDDFFTMNLYEGDIYKTRNLKNKSMMQLYPDPEEMKHAQDSIQERLTSFEKKLWVPSREELAAQREARENAEADAVKIKSRDSIDSGDDSGESVNEEEATKPKATSRVSRGKKSDTKKDTNKAKKKPKGSSVKQTSSSSSSAVRSVRRRR